MFHKLKIRFLILNLVMISVLMLLSFASIYLIMYQNVQSDINIQMHKLTEPRNNDIDDNNGPLRRGKNQLGAVSDDSVERSMSFVVTTDNKWNTLSTSTLFNISDTFMETAKNAAIAQHKDQGSLELNHEHWRFQVIMTQGQQKITFLNITSQIDILRNLVYTFLIVAIIMFILIYGISRFFAHKSIRPIEEAFEKQKQFIANASHELKTPLTVIDTNIDLLISNGEDSFENQLKWLKYIKLESERMAKLISNLLYLAKVDYSYEKMILTCVNLSDIVQELILTMEGVLYEHDIHFSYLVEPNIMIDANRDQIREVFAIILDNAIKYTEASGKMKATCQKINNSAMITVSNTGVGIPKEDLSKIFDRFYRADRSHARHTGGFGLGLSIAKMIVDQHKGKIYADSINGVTSFYVQLPVSRNSTLS